LARLLGQQTGWNIARTAARLEIAQNTLRARMERLDIQLEGGAPARPPSAERPASAPAAPVEPAKSGSALSATPSRADLPTIRWERRWVTSVSAPEQPDDPWMRSRPLDLAVEKVLGFGGRLEPLSQTSVGASFGLEPIKEPPSPRSR
jgi:hypothetical protein